MPFTIVSHSECPKHESLQFGRGILRLAHIFKSQEGDDLSLAISNISTVAEHCNSGFMEVVLPVISANCPTYSSVDKMALGIELLLVNMNCITPSVGKQFCTSAMEIICQGKERNMINIRTQEIHGELLCRIVQLVKWSSEEHLDLLLFFDSNIGDSASHLRRMAFQLLSAISLSNIDDKLLHKHIIPRIRNALPDVEPVITGEGIRFLAKLPAKFLSNVISERLWIEIIQIWRTDVDGSTLGKKATVQAAVVLVSELYEGLQYDTNNLEEFYKMLLRWATEYSKKDLKILSGEECELLRTIANGIGPLSSMVPRKCLRLCLNTYNSLSLFRDVRTRQSCAECLPAVSKVMTKRHSKAITRIIQRFVKDNAKEVRIAIAGGYHDSVKHLLRPQDILTHLHNTHALLTDEDSGAQLKVMANISDTLFTIIGCPIDLPKTHDINREILSTISCTQHHMAGEKPGNRTVGTSRKVYPNVTLEHGGYSILNRTVYEEHIWHARGRWEGVRQNYTVSRLK